MAPVTSKPTPLLPPAIAGVRALPVVAALGEPWQRQPNETPDEFAAFVTWLDQGADRAQPPSHLAATARKHSWAERAQAHARAQTLARLDASGVSPEQQVVQNLTRLAQIETKKLLDQALESGMPVASLKDIVAVIKQIQELHEAGRAAGAGAAAGATAAEMAKVLTEDELRAVISANKKMKDLKK